MATQPASILAPKTTLQRLADLLTETNAIPVIGGVRIETSRNVQPERKES